MKYVVFIGDGMADHPVSELNGRTPLEVAVKPHIDSIAREGRCGLLKTLREGLPLGSDVANLTVLGYDPRIYHSGGRGPLEAASMGVSLDSDDIAFRCNLITVEGERIIDHSGGHISSREGAELIKAVDKEFGKEDIVFYPGVGYRNILVLKGREYSDKVKCMPPHDIVNQKVSLNLVESISGSGIKTADLLNRMILESRVLLEKHPVNLGRIRSGKPLANSIWFWGHGRKLEMPSFSERYGIKGALISAVDLLKGIGVCLGMEIIDVPGITGYLDTNYEGKADYALKALENNDLVYVHVEAIDEASHEGSASKKIKAIEDFDKRLVGRVLEGLQASGDDYAIAVLPDHATPIKVRTHTSDLVPFAIYSPLVPGDEVMKYTENDVARGFYGERDALEFMSILLNTRK